MGLPWRGTVDVCIWGIREAGRKEGAGVCTGNMWDITLEVGLV